MVSNLLTTSAAATNHAGRVYRCYDGAGVATTLAFDFKGQPVEEQRQLVAQKTAQADWSILVGEDTIAEMATAAASLLDAETFVVFRLAEIHTHPRFGDPELRTPTERNRLGRRVDGLYPSEGDRRSASQGEEDHFMLNPRGTLVSILVDGHPKEDPVVLSRDGLSERQTKIIKTGIYPAVGELKERIGVSALESEIGVALEVLRANRRQVLRHHQMEVQ